MFKITNKVPLPKKLGLDWERLAPANVYPFHDMLPGDSFAVECRYSERGAVDRRLRAATKSHADYTSTHWVIRREAGGVRCWRVS